MTSLEEPTKSMSLLQAVVDAHGTGERRPQQEVMVNCVDDAIENQENLLIQAGTGVGKSLGYMIPAVSSGKRVVISTATKQLSEQLADKDVPFLQEVFQKKFGYKFSSAILKGRANYVCLRKVNELKDLENQASEMVQNQDVLFPADADDTSNTPTSHLDAKRRGEEVGNVISWVDDNVGKIDGDRSHAPQVSDATWKTLSATPNECPGRAACPFGNACFAEIARTRAKDADLVVTNHALVATELGSGKQWNAIGHREVVIFDEIHELDNYLSNTWGCSVTGRTIEEIARLAKRVVPAEKNKQRDAIEEISKASQTITDLLSDEKEDRLVDKGWAPEYLRAFEQIIVNAVPVIVFLQTLGDDNDRAVLAKNSLNDLSENMYMMKDESNDIVQWVGEGDRGEMALRAAPLRVGPRLMEALQESESIMIGTSATISVGGSFDIPVKRFALDDSLTPYKTQDVGTPFAYEKQSIMFIPSANSFPPPTGKERYEHTEAVLDALVKIVKAAGGRTLALSTTTYGARKMAERLRDEVDTPVYSQWDATTGVISQRFAEDENSTLCATMGMWHGLNVPGKSLSAVVIDKIPFPPMNDPLTNARTKDIEERGGNGFMDVSVAHATQMLSQGVGRLIRHTSDRGIVAILDPRLMGRASYGKVIVRSLPPMWRTDDFELLLKSLASIVAK